MNPCPADTGPGSWPLWRQYLLALAVIAAGLLLREALLPWLGTNVPFLPVFAALLVLVLLVRPGPFLAAAVLGVLAMTWRLGSSGRPIDLALFAGAVGVAGVAAWLSARRNDRLRAAWRQADEQRNELHVTLASLADGVITTDSLGRVRFVNEVASELTGWSAEQARGRPLGEVFRRRAESTRAALDSPVDQVLREGRSTSLPDTTVLLHRDGSGRPIDDSASAIHGADGRVQGVVVVFRDACPRRRAEQARMESEQRFQVMADTAPVLIWTCGTDRGCTWFNQPWLSFTGRRLEDELGDGWAEGIHPEDRERCLETWRSAFAARSSVSMDYRLRRHDGEYRWLLDTGAPRFDAGGRFVGYIGSCLDITDRKATEAALARSEALFRRISDANLIGVASGDTQGGVSYINDEMLRMMGRTREDFEAGRIQWVQSVAPEFAHLHEAWREQLMREGQVGRYERAFARPDGGRTPYMGAAALLAPGSGSDVHVRIALDLTPLRQSEESRDALVRQLREADRRKDEFLATLAHELRNPLAPAAHALEILKRPVPAAPDAGAATAKALNTLDRQLRHMVRLIDDLLDVSRITRDRLELRPGRVDLLAVLEHAVEAVRPALAAAGQALHIEHPAGPLWLQADPDRLSQVFTNLLGNAGKYSPPGSPVWLQVHAEAGALEVVVRDQGAGIARDTLPRLFDMFAQGDVQPGQSQGGLGIGLALARRLTELHGGEILAHSAGPGRGSEFTVRLPRAGSAGQALADGTGGAEGVVPTLAADPAVPAPAAAAKPAAAAAAWRVLVVDDNVDAANTLAMLLEITGHVVAVANDGPEALSQAERFRPQVVLLDIGLPRMDGHEVARRLRSQAWGRDTVLVALTGWGQAPDREASVAAGFDAHLVKPVEHEALMTLLRSLMGRKPEERTRQPVQATGEGVCP